MKWTFIAAVLLLMFSSMVTAQKQKLSRVPCTTDFSNIFLNKIDTSDSRGVADNYRIWDNGSTLLVKFMPGGSQSLRERVKRSAKEWESFANIKFEFVDDYSNSTNMRVQLGSGKGHSSSVGKEANLVSQEMQTINFDTLYFADVTYYVRRLQAKGVKTPYSWQHILDEMAVDPFHWDDRELRRVVLHEFGHALGLLHEQSFPGVIKWKKTDSVYNYYLASQKWDKKKVDFNVFEVSNQFFTNGTTYDARSIMHYAVEPWQTWDNYTVKNNFDLSSGDKNLIMALYPKNNKESDLAVPQVDINHFTRLDVKNNAAKGGLSIYPSFELKSNSKIGDVYFVARLLFEDGGKWYYISNKADKFNWGGTLATYTKITVLPNSRVSYNKRVQNIELFLPYSYIPDVTGVNVKVEFTVILDDVKNNQLDKLMYYSTTNPVSIIR